MARYIKTIKAKPGIAPGTLIYENEPFSDSVKIESYTHYQGQTSNKEISLNEVIPIILSEKNFWINIFYFI